MRVNFWCMRHGEKDAAGNVTAIGLRQVEASAKTHLENVFFEIILHSGLPRAKDSAMSARNALKLDCPVLAFPRFDYSGLSGPNVPGSDIAQARQRIGKPHDQATVYDWLEHYGWSAGYLRGNMLAAMLATVIYLKTNPTTAYVLEQGRANVLVVGHSPGLEMAADDPATTTSLNEADIIPYEVEVDQFGFTHFTTRPILRCPVVE